MTSDKQLKGIKLQDVRMKRDSDQALNVKEFAVLAGISYSVARGWFHLSGFPAIQGKVFWEDFVLWRRGQNRKSLTSLNGSASAESDCKPTPHKSSPQWPARAANILAEVH